MEIRGQITSILSTSIKRGKLLLHKELTEIITQKSLKYVLSCSGIPSSWSPQDFLRFLSVPVLAIRILRDSQSNHYLAFLQFSSDKELFEMYHKLDSTPYSLNHEESSISPNNPSQSSSSFEKCNAIILDSVGFCIGVDPYLFQPELFQNDPSEYLICPVCLDRIDFGLLTVICKHSFHATCLEKWEDASCPVCRFSLQGPPNECSICKASEHLWICLVCGSVGCGRYSKGHAEQHYKLTNHIYSLEIETQSVWDYAGDNYVHRLIQNIVDGKLVESKNPTDPEKSLSVKTQDIILEYTHLLTKQLESQREFFQSESTNDSKKYQLEIKKLEREYSALQSKFIDSERHHQEKYSLFEKKQIQIEKRLEKMHLKIDSAQKDQQDEAQLNELLMKNQEEYKKQIGLLNDTIVQKDGIINDLNDQIKGMILFAFFYF